MPAPELLLPRAWSPGSLFWLGMFPGSITQQGQTLPGRGLRWHRGVGNKTAKCHNEGSCAGATLLSLFLPWPGFWRLCRSFPRPCSCNLSPLGLYINHPSCQAFASLPLHLSETWALETGGVAWGFLKDFGSWLKFQRDPAEAVPASLSIFTPTCRRNPKLLRLGAVPVHTLDPAGS